MSMQTAMTQLVQRMAAEFKSIRSDMGGLKTVRLTMEQYRALPVKDPNTIYLLDSG